MKEITKIKINDQEYDISVEGLEEKLQAMENKLDELERLLS